LIPLGIFFPVVAFLVIVGSSNAVNLTDGLDGLAILPIVMVSGALGIFAYVTSNAIYAQYLAIPYVPNTQEITIFCASIVGAGLGFLWYNAYPAQIFMGDTGSLTIGGIIAVLAISVRKEMLLPVLCAIFFAENLSVILQVSYFKYTKKRFGEGKRIFLMSPLHHHYQKKGYHESKIVTRFWIVAILLAIVSIVTLKLR
jgi:phospho-N-acetylmuramoyl-pentapeptide-transferase